ncbi:unnamed protein product [Owenia fusiformis]|uniref:Non-specific serine/threonine protein kinase n=1 Tax=Owenia fusiformis TaxID=6347 RepID=A0A8S4PW50_OWEFU|nr:unnamed protein product [Owenia fusiformis]
MEEEEENFVLTALFNATEEANIEGIQELLKNVTNFDINQTNKHGESVLHIAASGGHIEIIELLLTKGINLSAKDKHGDSAVFWAARQGQVKVIEYLKSQDVSLDTQNKSGEAPIHVAARYGHTHVVEYLAAAGADINIQDKEEETPLHCAASRGNLECVKVLVDSGARLDLTDKRGCTALHMACRRHHINIALTLIHGGASLDMQDIGGETPLHPAAKEGLLPIVQTMCAFGCKVDLCNKGSGTALHLASRSGHIEVVRCLMLAGADSDRPNKDGITGEIMALAQGHTDIATLLARMKPDFKEGYISQLCPTKIPLGRIKLKIFGHSNVGKTTLIESLKCGYISGFFRKSSWTRASGNSMPSNNNLTTKEKGAENGIHRHNSLPSQLSFDVLNSNYTKGIDVQHISLTGAGDFTVWEFSGYEPYYMMYDHFIGDSNCIHFVLFNLDEPIEVQRAQSMYWLHFIRSRVPPHEPIGQFGTISNKAHVILVATHADKVGCSRNIRGEFVSNDASLIHSEAVQQFGADFEICDQVFVVDSNVATSAEMKALKNKLAVIKTQIVKTLPTVNGFLDAAVVQLHAWCKETAFFPVMPWHDFAEQIRSKVNPLASDDHLREIVQNLQLMGEVIYIEGEIDQDLVVVNPQWLCTEILGQLLSHEKIMQSRVTGCFTADDFQLMFPEVEATDMLTVLEALEICTQCENDGDIEYEFPCLNFIETLHGLWDKDVRTLPNPVYGGVRVQALAGMSNQMVHIFPRLQIHLRRMLIQEGPETESDLYQWYHGTKYCTANLECLLTMEMSDQAIEIKVRGPDTNASHAFYLLDEMSTLTEHILNEMCPGMLYEKHYLSPLQLKEHKRKPHSYTPHDLIAKQLENYTKLSLPDTEITEELKDVLCYGSTDIQSNVTMGVDLHVSHLSLNTRREFSKLLDRPDPMGRDWCLLAVKLDLADTLPSLDAPGRNQIQSRTDKTLEEWARDHDNTIGKLLFKLKDLGRQDAVDIVTKTMPPMKVFPPEGAVSPDEGVDTEHNGEATSEVPSNNSSTTLSR